MNDEMTRRANAMPELTKEEISKREKSPDLMRARAEFHSAIDVMKSAVLAAIEAGDKISNFDRLTEGEHLAEKHSEVSLLVHFIDQLFETSPEFTKLRILSIAARTLLEYEGEHK